MNAQKFILSFSHKILDICAKKQGYLVRVQYILDSYKKIIRIMPNTPCTVGEGMIPLCRSVCFDAVEAAYQKAKQLG